MSTYISEVIVYPNPTNGVLFITGLPNDKTTKLTVYNLNGKAIISDNPCLPSTCIDISDQPSGIYFIRFENNNTHVVKITKR